ncbi:MAG: ATP-binding cassette domain-containing protein [Marinilabiliaceae bacterium]
MSISVEKVDKYFGQQKVLDQVSFDIPAGEVVGFLGPNGAGKTTMMKIITGYLPATSGKVNVCGLSVEGEDLEIRRRVGYLPEHNPLYLDMYVTEYLLSVAEMYKLPGKREKVEEIIRTTGLTPERHKKIGTLSKGYRQRVGLAQALLPDPEVLILDEPTSGLDPNQIVEVRNLIRELGKEKTVLLSTHIMQEVKAICERVMIINKGAIVADGPADELERARDKSPAKIFVEFDGPLAPEKINALEGVASVAPKDEGWLITVSGDHEVRPALTRLAVDNDRVILTLTAETGSSLESAFQSLTV